MPGTNDWADNFAGRCSDVGWRVERTTSNHFKVFDTNGKMIFTFASTPGDKRAMLNALSQAKRNGLEQLESTLKLRREKERLEKIEADRAANDAATALLIAKAPRHDVLGLVNGVAIVSIAPAKVKTPVMTEPGPLADGEELLLANEQVLYRCAKSAATPKTPDAVGLCHRVFPSAESLRAHITFHTRKTPPVTPAQRRNASAKEDPVPVAKVKTAASNGTHPDAVKALATKVSTLSDAVSGLITASQNIVLELSTIQHDLAKLNVADPDTIEKARQFDNLKAMFKQ